MVLAGYLCKRRSVQNAISFSLFDSISRASAARSSRSVDLLKRGGYLLFPPVPLNSASPRGVRAERDLPHRCEHLLPIPFTQLTKPRYNVRL